MIKPYTFLISSALNLIFHWTSHKAFWDCRETQAAYLNSLYIFRNSLHIRRVYICIFYEKDGEEEDLFI